MVGFRLVGKRDAKVDLNWNLAEEGMWYFSSSTEFLNKGLSTSGR